jgi:hypothetical protein
MRGCIITVKGNESGSRSPTRWKVIEAVNARAAWNSIMFALATGSVGAKDTRQDVAADMTRGPEIVLAHVVRILPNIKEAN